MLILNTAQKITIATIAYKLVSRVRRILGKSDQVVIRRNGITWDLDLREGIDFSIFLFGGFELATLRLYESIVHAGDVVLDIGANIGAHTLPFASLVGRDGRVYAFEPTQYAYEKLSRNVKANPIVAPNIELVHAMLVSESSNAIAPQVYSSWPLIKEEGLHEQHRGKLKSTADAEIMTVDEFVARGRIDRIDFVKLDVDGNEAGVLAGAANTLRSFRPRVLMEWAPYLFQANSAVMQQVLSNFIALGYCPKEPSGRRVLPKDFAGLNAMVPKFGSMNVLFETSDGEIRRR
jgi:FkbM family methyltransferase